MPDQQYHHIDPFVLLEATGDDLASFRDLSKTFLRIAPPLLVRLEGAILAGDCKATSHASHALKGTTSLVGATQLTQMLQDIENLALHGDQDSMAPHIPELTRLFGAVMQEVQASIVSFQKGAGRNRNAAPA